METMDDLNTAPKNATDLAERRRVIDLHVIMRGENRNEFLATPNQIEMMIRFGRPWRECFEATRDDATSFLWRYRETTGALRRRYDADQERANKPRCSCPHCLGHD